MFTSNFAFRVLWHPTRWDSSFDNVWLLSADPFEPIRRRMEAVPALAVRNGNREPADGFQCGLAHLLTGRFQIALVRALDAYKQEARLLREFADVHLHFTQWYAGAKQPQNWDPRTRQAQADLLAKAFELEEEALKACEEVLAAERKDAQ